MRLMITLRSLGNRYPSFTLMPYLLAFLPSTNRYLNCHLPYQSDTPTQVTVFLRPINRKTSFQKIINFNQNRNNVEKLSLTKESSYSDGHDDGWGQHQKAY